MGGGSSGSSFASVGMNTGGQNTTAQVNTPTEASYPVYQMNAYDGPEPNPQWMKNIDDAVTKFVARNFFGKGPADFVRTMDGRIIAMSESGTQFAYSERIFDLSFLCVSSITSVIRIASATSAAAGISKGTAANRCFIAGTLVSSESGLVPIETIKAGDKVFAWNEQTGEIALKEVVRTFVHETDQILKVTTEDCEIITTEIHPFWTEEHGWIEAGSLEAEDTLKTKEDKLVKVIEIEKITLQESILVYNIEVEGFHTYYVTEEEILVHNKAAKNPAIEKLQIKYIYNSIKDAPSYPKGFNAVKGGTKKVNINNQEVLESLRSLESGKWMKVYKNGYDVSGNQISIHYFQSESGKVFNVKVKDAWSIW